MKKSIDLEYNPTVIVTVNQFLVKKKRKHVVFTVKSNVNNLINFLTRLTLETSSDELVLHDENKNQNSILNALMWILCQQDPKRCLLFTIV